MATIEVNGARFGYDDAGTGPAVVLLHSAAGPRQTWDAQFADLARDHRVIRYDRRGFGESADPTAPYSHSADLLALMDALDIGQAALVGASMGGACSLDTALLAPERVTRLALLGSALNGRPWPEAMQAEMLALVETALPLERFAQYQAGSVPDADPAHAEALADLSIGYLMAGPNRTTAVLPPEMVARLREMSAEGYLREWSRPLWTEEYPDTRNRLSEITAPALVVVGEEDASGLLEIAAELAAELPHAEYVAMPATGHLPSMERPAETTALLRRFLAG